MFIFRTGILKKGPAKESGVAWRLISRQIEKSLESIKINKE
jgi:hypothetical protein